MTESERIGCYIEVPSRARRLKLCGRSVRMPTVILAGPRMFSFHPTSEKERLFSADEYGWYRGMLFSAFRPEPGRKVFLSPN